MEEPDVFWHEQTSDLVWRKPWDSFSEFRLDGGRMQAKFFVGAKLNLTESCLDRHLHTARRTKAALIWEGEPGDTRTWTYFDLHREVVRLAAALTDLGVSAGDRVAIYMGMVPETVVAMLACARLGAPHSVVFGGFSADALRDRMNDLGAKVLLTQDGAWRRGNVVPLKKMADAALAQSPGVEKVVVLRRIGAHATWRRLGDAGRGADEGGARRLVARLSSSGRRAAPRRAGITPTRSTPSIRSSFSTRPARRASRRASFTPRRGTSSACTSRPSTSSISATRTCTGAPPTSAG